MFCNTDLVNCIYKKFVNSKKRTTLKCSSYNKVIYSGKLIVYCDNLSSKKQYKSLFKESNTTLKIISSKYKFLKDYVEVYIEDVCVGLILQYDSCVSFFEQSY